MEFLRIELILSTCHFYVFVIFKWIEIHWWQEDTIRVVQMMKFQFCFLFACEFVFQLFVILFWIKCIVIYDWRKQVFFLFQLVICCWLNELFCSVQFKDTFLILFFFLYDFIYNVFFINIEFFSGSYHVIVNWREFIWNVDGNLFLSSFEDGRVELRDIRKIDTRLWNLQAHQKECTSISIYGNDCFVTGGADKSMRIWKIQNNMPVNVRSFNTKGDVLALSFCKEQPGLLSVGGEFGLKFMRPFK